MISKGFINRSILCGFCAAAEAAELQSKSSETIQQPQISGELSSSFNADSNQQYGKKDNERVFGVQ